VVRAVAGVAVVLLTTACAGFEEPALQLVTPETLTRIAIPPVAGQSGQFGIMTMDQANHLVFVTDGLDQGVDVIDVAFPPGHYVRKIQLPDIPAGLTYVSELHRLYTADADSSVSVIDADPASPHPYTVLQRISTGGAGVADLIDYDPQDHKLYVTNPDDGFITSIDVATNRVVGRIANLGATEQPRFDAADGMLYVPRADDNSILKIDPRKDRLVGEYKLPLVCVPHGLAINPATNQGLIGCGDKDSLITLSWDFNAERVLQSFDFAGGGDEAIFDPVAQHFYFAAQGYAPPEIAIFNAAPITFLTAVSTSHHSLNVAYDETHQLIYTVDGLHLEAALWAFPDPVAGCFGHEGQLASEGAPRSETPHCHPKPSAEGA
jgi:YVTN family beta-propeller protein